MCFPTGWGGGLNPQPTHPPTHPNRPTQGKMHEKKFGAFGAKTHTPNSQQSGGGAGGGGSPNHPARLPSDPLAPLSLGCPDNSAHLCEGLD